MTRLFLALAFVLLALPGCEDELAEPTCDVGGELHGDGEVFPAGDGCNTCACNPDGDTPGQFQCSLLDCSQNTQCTDEPPLGVSQCPAECNVSATSGADCCGLTCVQCTPVGNDEFGWVIFAIDC